MNSLISSRLLITEEQHSKPSVISYEFYIITDNWSSTVLLKIIWNSITHDNSLLITESAVILN